MDNQPIVIEKILDAPVASVWTAITDKNEMKEWYFDLKEFKAVPGFTFSFKGGPSPEKQYLHLCEVTEVIPQKRLSYTWRYDGYGGNSLVSFTLTPQGNKTSLRFTHEGLESFPANEKDFARSNFEEGWDQIINHSLTEYVLRNAEDAEGTQSTQR
jgi:uncharacterized protein YndB with AHSA1/START domain